MPDENKVGFVPDSTVLPPGQPAGEQELDAHEATPVEAEAPDGTGDNPDFAGEDDPTIA